MPAVMRVLVMGGTEPWYQREGLVDRAVDFAFQDQLLAKLGT